MELEWTPGERVGEGFGMTNAYTWLAAAHARDPPGQRQPRPPA
jgi:hypothetical protein